MAATLGNTGITFSDNTSITSYNQIIQPIVQLSTFGSIAANATVGRITSTVLNNATYWLAGTVILWGNMTSNYGRGTYYSSMQLLGNSYLTTNVIGGTTTNYPYSGLGNPTVSNLIPTATGTGTSMVVSVYCELYFGTDDSFGYYMMYVDNSGAEVPLLALNTGTGSNTSRVIFNGNVTIPANTTREFRVYGSVLGGSSSDSISVKRFTVSFNSWI
jgi:hypothetical protein